jgi:TRAP-type transport system small permease protein
MVMRRILRVIDSLLLGAAILLFAAFLSSVFLQVLFRYVIEMPLPWTEEVAVHLFIWSSFLAASVITGRDDHFAIDFFTKNLPARLDWSLRILSTALSLLFALIVVYKGVGWSLRMLPMRTSVLQMSQGAVYAVIPLSAIYMGVHLALRLATLFQESQDGRGRPC